MASIAFSFLKFLTLVFQLLVACDSQLPTETTLNSWNYPGCWQTSRLRGRILDDSPVSKYDRIVIIGDIHATLPGLLEILRAARIIPSQDRRVTGELPSSRECVWHSDTYTKPVLFIQTGDFVDRGRYSLETFECLKSLQDSAQTHLNGSRVIRLLGNHELLWLGGEPDHRNKEIDTPSRVNDLTKRIMIDVVEGKIMASFFFKTYAGVNVLVSHAGLRAKMKSKLEALVNENKRGDMLAHEMSLLINAKLLADIEACKFSLPNFDSYNGSIDCRRSIVGEIYSVAEDRGGSGLGGSFWTDFGVLQAEAEKDMLSWNFVQIVGHTLERGKIRATANMWGMCVDAGIFIGGRAYMEIRADGRFRSFEKKDGPVGNNAVWVENDLIDTWCPA